MNLIERLKKEKHGNFRIEGHIGKDRTEYYIVQTSSNTIFAVGKRVMNSFHIVSDLNKKIIVDSKNDFISQIPTAKDFLLSGSYGFLFYISEDYITYICFRPEDSFKTISSGLGSFFNDIKVK